MTTAKEARDDIFELIDSLWDGATYPISWPDVRGENRPETLGQGSIAWLKVRLFHGPGSQTTVGSATGNQRHRQTGVLVCSVYAASGDGNELLYDLCQVLLDGFRANKVTDTHCVILRNISGPIEEEPRDLLEPDAAWSIAAVTTTFEYDDFI